MSNNLADYTVAIDAVADLIRDAGGRVVGRTKLQKIACLLELAGYGVGFDFRYKHFGPYSEQLASAAQLGPIFEKFFEEEKIASWGGRYSIYSSPVDAPVSSSSDRVLLAKSAADADSVELELAVTAAFLAHEGESDPWGRTELLKPEKSRDGRLDRAKELYRRLRSVDVDTTLLPKI